MKDLHVQGFQRALEDQPQLVASDLACTLLRSYAFVILLKFRVECEFTNRSFLGDAPPHSHSGMLHPAAACLFCLSSLTSTHGGGGNSFCANLVPATSHSLAPVLERWAAVLQKWMQGGGINANPHTLQQQQQQQLPNLQPDMSVSSSTLLSGRPAYVQPVSPVFSALKVFLQLLEVGVVLPRISGQVHDCLSGGMHHFILCLKSLK